MAVRLPLVCLVLLSFTTAIIGAEMPGWHTVNGGIVTGEISEVFGSLVMITGKKTMNFVPLTTLTDSETARVAEFIQSKRTAPVTWADSTAKITKNVRRYLDLLQDGRLAPYNPNDKPEPEVYLIYFSAKWCHPCHVFTPKLVEAYHEWQKVIPGRVEVIFVSSDKDDFEQEKYIKEATMPWPALHFSDLGRVAQIERFAGNGIPNLVAVTRDGNLIFSSYRGEEYLGADSVLDSCKSLVPMLIGKSPDIMRARHRLAVAQRVVATGSGNSNPAPYLTPFNPGQFQAIDTPELALSLKIDELGKVTDVQIKPELSAELQDSLTRVVTDWLFLPAIEHGQLRSRTVTLPLKFNRPKKTVAADGL